MQAYAVSMPVTISYGEYPIVMYGGLSAVAMLKVLLSGSSCPSRTVIVPKYSVQIRPKQVVTYGVLRSSLL